MFDPLRPPTTGIASGALATVTMLAEIVVVAVASVVVVGSSVVGTAVVGAVVCTGASVELGAAVTGASATGAAVVGANSGAVSVAGAANVASLPGFTGPASSRELVQPAIKAVATTTAPTRPLKVFDVSTRI